MRQPVPIRCRVRLVVAEIQDALDQIDADAVADLLAAMAQAPRVFFAGQGRSGLIARAFAMRWMHLGHIAYVAGETVTPAIDEGDLLICLSANGRTAATLGHANTARAVGARVAALTTVADGPLADIANMVVVVPIRTRVATAQHAGSLFEQTCLLLADVICGVHQELTTVPENQLDRRHANLL